MRKRESAERQLKQQHPQFASLIFTPKQRSSDNSRGKSSSVAAIGGRKDGESPANGPNGTVWEQSDKFESWLAVQHAKGVVVDELSRLNCTSAELAALLKNSSSYDKLPPGVHPDENDMRRRIGEAIDSDPLSTSLTSQAAAAIGRRDLVGSTSGYIQALIKEGGNFWGGELELMKLAEINSTAGGVYRHFPSTQGRRI